MMGKASEVRFFDGRSAVDGSARIAAILGPEIATRPGETFNSVTYGVRARTLEYTSGTNSRNVVLGANFFGREPADQGITLAHEALHYGLNRDDIAFARKAGYAGNDYVEASEVFSDWLKTGCP